uniref:Uncharacterized protein n=1 Tax=Mesocestoides corti TaxID=53468 RepID=A0A5K3EKZ3_MESCO
MVNGCASSSPVFILGGTQGNLIRTTCRGLKQIFIVFSFNFPLHVSLVGRGRKIGASSTSSHSVTPRLPCNWSSGPQIEPLDGFSPLPGVMLQSARGAHVPSRMVIHQTQPGY